MKLTPTVSSLVCCCAFLLAAGCVHSQSCNNFVDPNQPGVEQILCEDLCGPGTDTLIRVSRGGLGAVSGYFCNIPSCGLTNFPCLLEDATEICTLACNGGGVQNLGPLPSDCILSGALILCENYCSSGADFNIAQLDTGDAVCLSSVCSAPFADCTAALSDYVGGTDFTTAFPTSEVCQLIDGCTVNGAAEPTLAASPMAPVPATPFSLPQPSPRPPVGAPVGFRVCPCSTIRSSSACESVTGCGWLDPAGTGAPSSCIGNGNCDDITMAASASAMTVSLSSATLFLLGAMPTFSILLL